MKGIVIAAEFAAVNRAKIIKTNERCCCFAMPRINFDSRHTMKVQNVQAVQPLPFDIAQGGEFVEPRSVQIVNPFKQLDRVRVTTPGRPKNPEDKFEIRSTKSETNRSQIDLKSVNLKLDPDPQRIVIPLSYIRATALGAGKI